ncbi:transmembrane protein 209 [Phoenix dactylifera]|uniref:Transmembrane protein 209 n=1 Tax=Phoenix dactylifera TaxID=42345 RepID=A0A8B7C7X6_PHODC|nr:transmembrane protein 209 [Phoenix dactylifera]
MEGANRSPPRPSQGPKAKFSVYQNPNFAAALTARSLQPSASALLLISSSFLASALSLLSITSREDSLVKSLTRIHVSFRTAQLLTKVLEAAVGLVFVATLSALIRALSLRNTKNALGVAARSLSAASPSKKPKEQKSLLTERQLGLLGLKPKPTEATVDAEPVKKPPKSRPVPSSEPLVPIRKSAFSYAPSRPSRIGSDAQSSGGGKKLAVSPISPSASLSQYTASPGTPWSRQSSGSAKGIQTEAMLEQFLADVDEKITESAIKAAATPSPTIRGFGIASPGSVATSATASGATRSTPLRPVRMSPGSHQKYTTPPKKGEGELHPPMSMEQAVEAFESLGVYPQIEWWRDRLRQWFSSNLVNPLLEKIETSHIQVMQAAASVGIPITVSQVGSGTPPTATLPINTSPIEGAREWQPTFTLDEDRLLHQLRAILLQARDQSISQVPLAGAQQPQPNPLLPVIQACVDAITEHQRLNTLMKGELIKGLLPQSSVRADYTVQRVRELAEGTCLKNYEYTGNGVGYDKADKKWTSELPTDSHLLLYLFCAFLEHPKWMLHVDPTSYSGAQSSKNPLFLGVLPPKEKFPEKYVAVISGIPAVIHPGACILAVGKQSPPIFALYWDKKLQFSLQGRTALWDAILLLCHKIKQGYGGIVRGVHLGSSAFNILPILDSAEES